MADVRRAARLVESATHADAVIEAGKYLAHARRRLLRYASGYVAAGETHRAAVSLFDAAAVSWVAKSREPEVLLAVLRMLDPAAAVDSVRLSAVGLRLCGQEDFLRQFRASLAVRPPSPPSLWRVSHEVLLMTEQSSLVLASGGGGPIRIAPDKVEVALVPSEQVAEVAAALWEPAIAGMPYTRLCDAVEAATALMAAQFVTSRSTPPEGDGL